MVVETEKKEQVTDDFRLRTQEFFVPVHGFVQVFPEEGAVINHPVYQRLRRMRQLGFAHHVFPGANHTRFEHSIGALHVVSKMIFHLDENHKQDELSEKQRDTYSRSILLNEHQQRFVRLAALCHDIGHLPFSHTLEDELNHFEKHDGADRLLYMARLNLGPYRLPPDLAHKFGTDLSGAGLGSVIDHLYNYWLSKLFKGNVPVIGEREISSFDVFCALAVKEKDLTQKGSSEDRQAWGAKLTALSGVLPVNACRDMVGDTICADFLDYIHRDWYHVGKPMQVDERIYHYMRILKPAKPTAHFNEDMYRFVIDVGPKMRVRHDALTLILDLLESRYKLTETVLFHRTKLGVIALLDRILLGIRDLWAAAGIGGADGPARELQQKLAELLSEQGDDCLGIVLNEMRVGTHAFKSQVDAVVKYGIAKNQEDKWGNESDQGSMLSGFRLKVVDSTLYGENDAVKSLYNELESMIERLEYRDLYTLAEKVDVESIGGVPTEGNHYVNEFIDLYSVPENRHLLIRAIEDKANLPRGSVIMYCPLTKKMGAKIAQVNLHTDGRIQSFESYEREAGATGLTCNALSAQVSRFYQLWAVSFFVDRHHWASMGMEAQGMFRHLVRALCIPMRDKGEAAARLAEVAALHGALGDVRQAARGGAHSASTDFTGPTWNLPIGLEVPIDGN